MDGLEVATVTKVDFSSCSLVQSVCIRDTGESSFHWSLSFMEAEVDLKAFSIL